MNVADISEAPEMARLRQNNQFARAMDTLGYSAPAGPMGQTPTSRGRIPSTMGGDNFLQRILEQSQQRQHESARQMSLRNDSPEDPVDGRSMRPGHLAPTSRSGRPRTDNRSRSPDPVVSAQPQQTAGATPRHTSSRPAIDTRSRFERDYDSDRYGERARAAEASIRKGIDPEITQPTSARITSTGSGSRSFRQRSGLPTSAPQTRRERNRAASPGEVDKSVWSPAF